MRVPLIATKGLTYGTRRLKAEDPFEAVSRSDARVLQAIGKARPADPEEDPAVVLANLRDQYTEKVGKRPYHGWDEATLREKIAAAEAEA